MRLVIRDYVGIGKTKSPEIEARDEQRRIERDMYVPEPTNYLGMFLTLSTLYVGLMFVKYYFLGA